jgi:anti-sigma factor RsiW
MMSQRCRRVQPLLVRYADDALASKDHARLERHLRSCKACASMLEEYRAVNDYIRVPRLVEPSPYLWQRIRRSLELGHERQRAGLFVRLRPVLIPFAGAAVVTVAVFTASLLSRTIVRTGQDAAVQTINVQPEDGRATVSQESIPSIPADTLEDED